MRYSDWALGQFFDKVRNQPWFKQTLFVVVGDHGFGAPEKSPRWTCCASVPLLLIAPGVTERFGSRREVVGTQVDVVPTIMGRLGGEVRHQCWGRDLLSLPADDPGFGIVKPSGSDQTVALIRGDRVLVQPRSSRRGCIAIAWAVNRLASGSPLPRISRSCCASCTPTDRHRQPAGQHSGDRSGEGESEAVAAEVPLAVKAARRHGRTRVERGGRSVFQRLEAVVGEVSGVVAQRADHRHRAVALTGRGAAHGVGTGEQLGDDRCSCASASALSLQFSHHVGDLAAHRLGQFAVARRADGLRGSPAAPGAYRC